MWKIPNCAALGAAAFIAAIVTIAGDGTPARAVQHSNELPDGVFAVIDGEQVTHDEFRAFLVQYARSKSYHGITEETLQQVRQEAVDALIDQRLVAHEADRRGIDGDPAAVERQLANYEARYGESENWPEIKKQWPVLRERLLEMTKIAELEESVRRVGDPSDEQLRAYYDENLELFTQPERIRLSVILLGVDPSAGPDEWEMAREKAGELFAKIEGGADFADLARQHSTHDSAANGGNLGLIHGGQLSETAQSAVDALEPGQSTPPVRVLEGYALFRLHEKLPPRVSGYRDVRERVLALYQREQTDARWSRFIGSLRADASIVVDSGRNAEPRD